MQTGVQDLGAKIAQTEAEILKVNTRIDDINTQIDQCVVKQAQSKNKKEVAFLRKRELRLREEVNKLREELMQLRDEKYQLRDDTDDKGKRIQAAPEISLYSDSALQHAAKNAFEAPYQDSLGVVQNLLEAIDTCRESWQTCKLSSDQLYAPYLAVVQSSMMGKSRMFYTLHRHNIYVFYICLKVGGSYPSGIPEVFRALTSNTCTEGYYAAFMLAALEALNDFMVSDRYTGISTSDRCSEWFKLQQTSSFWNPVLGEDVQCSFCDEQVK